MDTDTNSPWEEVTLTDTKFDQFDCTLTIRIPEIKM